ncbi:Mitochondrial acidic protein mam33 [Entomophthora muscae]|uniref:Mitochondrial acidic protein mam33 n=1 Tax=Entomophthora muscae TaxID=34485 RepID=A0ACC2U3H4_9FUNG|nr:Mitochondrial acidic protein mam33 [Entomophthora muscae]
MASLRLGKSIFRSVSYNSVYLKGSYPGKLLPKPFSTSSFLNSSQQEPKPTELPLAEPSTSQKLAKCLEKELTHELSKKTAPNPRMLAYLEKSGFKLVQTDGDAIVELRKWVKKETIIVRFTILDLHHSPIDPALLAPNVFSPENEHPIKFHAVLAKPGKGSIFFDCMIVDASLETHNVMYYPETWRAQPTRVSDTPRLCDKVYISMFGDLEDEIKEAIEIHLENRGIDEEMAAFVREYAVFKEQNEYMSWLNNVRKFMLA